MGIRPTTDEARGRTVYAVRLGLVRGWIEFRGNATNVHDRSFTLVVAATVAVILAVESGSTYDGWALAALTLPGAVAMVFVIVGVAGMVGILVLEREDTTLLRTRALPRGLTALAVSRMVTAALETGLTIVLVLVPALLIRPDVAAYGVPGWPTLLWLVPLGLLATAPVGVVIGCLVDNVRVAGVLTLLGAAAFTAVSGIFYPLARLPEWVHAVVEVFPVYWLGLGMRSAFLPDAASAVEIGGSWRLPSVAVVLGAWAVAGLVVAPFVARRAANRASAVGLENRRRTAMQRVG